MTVIVSTCPTCNGSGMVLTVNANYTLQSRCSDCGGSGRREEVIATLKTAASAQTTTTACGHCDGFGYFTDKSQCRWCNGTGRG